jgi:threonine/homoserine/homoserine lactone efflux protein
LYVVARTIAQGKRAGLSSVAGVALGNLGNALGASLGLAALFAVYSFAFTLVKFAGAAYLVFLGIKVLLAAPAALPTDAIQALRVRRIFRDGFAVALLNPKTALFFAAFLPQFIDPAASALWQSVLLGGTFVLVAACTDTMYVMAASRAASALGGARFGAGRYLTASLFIGLGLFAAASGSRPGR